MHHGSQAPLTSWTPYPSQHQRSIIFKRWTVWNHMAPCRPKDIVPKSLGNVSSCHIIKRPSSSMTRNCGQWCGWDWETEHFYLERLLLKALSIIALMDYTEWNWVPLLIHFEGQINHKEKKAVPFSCTLELYVNIFCATTKYRYAIFDHTFQRVTQLI